MFLFLFLKYGQVDVAVFYTGSGAFILKCKDLAGFLKHVAPRMSPSVSSAFLDNYKCYDLRSIR